MNEERRVHPRLPLPIQARLVIGESERMATVEDLSAGGAGLRLTEELPEGTEIEALSFTLPASADSPQCEISVRGIVVRCIPLEQSEGESGCRAGISFVDLEDEWHRRIQQYIYQTLTKGRPTADEMPLERRRVALEKPVAIKFDRFDEFIKDVSTNISVSGMFVRTNDPKPPGTVFTFSFQLGDDFALVEGRGEVVWTRRKSLDRNRPAGMGVRFFDLDDRSRNTILSMVKKASETTTKEPKKRAEPIEGVFRVTSDAKAIPLMTVTGGADQPADAKAKEPAGESGDSRVETLRQELARRTKHYEGRIGELEERISELTGSRVDEETQRREFEATTSELQGLNEELEKKLVEAKGQVGELRDQIHDLETETSGRKRKTGALENRLLAVEQAMKAVAAERDELTVRIRESSDVKRDLESRIESLETGGEASELEGLRLELEESINRATVLEDRRLVAERERDELAEGIAKQASVEDSYRLVAEGAEGKRAELETKLEEARVELDRLGEKGEKEKADLQRRIEASDVSLRDLEEEVDSAREQVTSFEEKKARLEAAVEEEARKRHEVEEVLRRTEDELERAIGEHEELETGLRQEAMTALAAADGAKGSLEHLETALAKAQEEGARLGEAQEGSRAQLDEMQREVEDAKATTDDFVKRIAVLEADLESAETTRQDLVRQIETLQERGLKAEEGMTISHGEAEELRAQAEGRIAELEDEVSLALQENETQAAEMRRLEVLLSETDEAIDEARERATLSDELAGQLEEERARAEALELQLGQLESASQEQTGDESVLHVALTETDEWWESDGAASPASSPASVALQEEVATLQAAVRGLNNELERRDRKVELATWGTGKRKGIGWPRAAALAVAGLALGALVGGYGSRFLPLMSGGFADDDTAAAAAITQPLEVAAQGVPQEVPGEESRETLVDESPGVTVEELGDTSASVQPAVAASLPSPSEVASAWAAAWSDQRVDDYLSFYDSEFEPPNGAGRRAWEAYRRERLEAPESISVTLVGIEETDLDAQHTSVVFEQAYRAGSYSDRVRKTLNMVRREDGWKILGEQSEVL